MKTRNVGSNKKVLNYNLAEPLNGAATAKIDIHAGDGNLTIDRQSAGEQSLACGLLQYFENQGLPSRTMALRNGQAALTLRGSPAGRPWFHLPWAACNGAKEWQIQLNPTVPSEIIAHSDGGNIKLNLEDMAVTGVAADTGGGNIEVVLPDNAGPLRVTAKTGAGNVLLSVPSGAAVRIHATTGLGKVIIDPRFSKIDNNTYLSPDFDRAANQYEITASSGAGNVIVNFN